MKPTSLDQLISTKAEEFADQVRAAAAIADKEEEIRIEVEKQLAFLQKEAGVKLQGKHEFTVASGRIDSVYNAVIIEYKNPSGAAARIGPGANSPGAKKVVEQIKSRFYDLRSKERWNTLFGVGCDGKHFVFVRFYNDKWQVQDPVEVNKHSVERFLWALFNLGTKGKRFFRAGNSEFWRNGYEKHRDCMYRGFRHRGERLGTDQRGAEAAGGGGETRREDG